MAVNYSPAPPVAGVSRSTSPTEVERWTEYADTIGDVDTRLDNHETRIDTLEASPGGGASTAADVSVADAGGYYTATHVEGALQELGGQLLPYSGAKVTRTTTQSAASGAWTAIQWTAESWDDGAWVDLAIDNTRITVPSGVGKVEIKSNVSFAHATTGRRLFGILKNGASTPARVDVHPVQTAGGPTLAQITAEESVVAGDYFQIRVFHDTGSAINIAGDICWASIRRIDD